jgi:hypothetical protein
MIDELAFSTREKIPKVTASRTRTPDFDCTCAEMRMI